MDNTDLKILELLQKNARLTIRKIGEIIGLTPPATAERIKKLESEAVITGYHASVDPVKLGKGVRAYICVDVKKDKHAAFDNFCIKSPNVISFSKVIGTYYAILLVAVSRTAELGDVLDSIKSHGGMATHTAVIIHDVFTNKPF